MKFQSNSIFNGKITANSVADAGTNTDKFLVLSSNGDVSYRTAAELYIDLGIGSLPAGYTSTLKHQVKAGVALTKGQAVYVTSADGTNMIVGKASNGAESTSSKTLGLIETSLSNNGIGNVITEGLLAGLDTTGANAAGDPVWLGTNGNLIYGLLNKPSAPAHLVFIGVVTRVNANNGEIFVKVQNGFEMGELHNYAESGVQNNDIITWESSTSLYKPKSIATILGYTPVPTTRTLTINGTAYDLSADRSWTISANINARTEYEFTTDGSSATYNATYTVGQVDVFYNGSKLASTEFTATTGTSVVLGFTPPSGQVVEVVAWETGGGVSNGRTLTINGVSYDLSADRSWTISSGISGSGTTNYLPKWSSSTGLGNSNIYDNGNYLGIKTTNPLADLHVYNGSAAASILLQTNSSTDYGEIAVRNAAAVATSYFRQYSSSATGSDFGISRAGLALFFSNYATNFAIGTRNGGDLILGTADTERARLLASNGYFGINTSSPSYLLDVNGTGRFSGNVAIGNISIDAWSTFNVLQFNGKVAVGQTGFSKNIYFNGTDYVYSSNGYASLYQQTSGGGHTFLVAPSGTAGGVVSLTTALTLASTGAATFTGALNGTSATFSGVVTLNAYGNQLKIGSNGATDSFIGQGSGQNNLFIGDYNTATKGLTINVSTGAATFSGSVETTGAYFLNGNAYFGKASSIFTGGSASDAGIMVAGSNNIIFGNALTERMRITSAGNVGIGTSSPSALLHINGGQYNSQLRLSTNSVNGAAINLSNSDTGGHDWYIISTGSGNGGGAGNLGFYDNTNGNYLLYIKGSNGNVGIGTSSPSGILDVKASSGATIVNFINNAASLSALVFQESGTNRSFIQYLSPTFGTSSRANSLEFGTLSNAFISFRPNDAEAMRITSGGNVGIGTSSPEANSQLTLYGGSYSQLHMQNGTTGTGSNGFRILMDGNNLTMTNREAGYWAFETSDVERMRITSGGNVLIGGSTDNGYRLDVRGGQTIFNTTSAAVVAMQRLSTDGQILQFYKDSTLVGSISTNSNSLPSDLNFKKNINNLELGLNLVYKLRPVSYNHKIDDEGAALSTGFIAQELEESLTELGVKQNQYYILQNTPNEDETQSQYWLDYTKMIPVLVKAIQEQQIQIEELKARLN